MTILPRLTSFLLGAIICSIFFVPYLPLWGVKPYTDVKIHSEVWDERSFTLGASFVKNGQCTLVSFSVVAFASDIPVYVKYRDLDGLSQEFDREEGAQGLNIIVDVERDSIDYLETRTRHRCIDEQGNEEVTTKVFSRHEAAK